MGSQVSFFLGDADYTLLEDILSSRDEVVFLKERTTSPLPPVIQKPAITADSFWSMYAMLTADLDSVELHRVKTTDWYTYDVMRDPVLEISLGVIEGMTIYSGRLFFDKYYYDEDGKRLEKSARFVSWAGSKLASLKRRFVSQGDRFYAGPGALKMQDQGYALQKAPRLAPAILSNN